MASPLNLVNSKFVMQSVGSYGTSTSSPTKSILNGTRFYFHPGNKLPEPPTNNTIDKIHSVGDQDIYDTSINSLIDYTKQYPAMRLKAADFAYLSDLGRFPNNRLIIARRFRTPVPNDLTSIDEDKSLVTSPLSTMIGWVPDKQEEFFKMSFGENWTEQEGGLSELLGDIFSAKSVGGRANKGIGGATSLLTKFVPMGGLTRGLQVDIFNELGLTKATPDNLPEGNPNLISEAKERVIGKGLSSEFEIEFNTKYEQKFINNVDPTIVFLDIINNALRFGTSNSDFLITGQGGDTIKDFFKKFRTGRWDEAIGVILKVIIKVMGALASKVGKLLKAVKDDALAAFGADAETDPDKIAAEKKSAIGKQFDISITRIGAATISRYKVKINSIISSMTGIGSTPWHVTMGNPKRPFFSSGDLITDKVNISFGNRLGFNNLPSTIDISFKLKPARNLGAQEIFERFSIGGGRSYLPIPDPLEVSIITSRTDVFQDVDKNGRITAQDIKENKWVQGKDWASGTELEIKKVGDGTVLKSDIENKSINAGSSNQETPGGIDNQLNKTTNAENKIAEQTRVGNRLKK